MYTKGELTIETPCGFPYSGLYIVPVARKDFPFYIAEIRQLREREESDANAERLVKCWNSHDDLLEALKEMVECSPCQNGCDKDDMTCTTRKAEAVINAAEGKV